MATLRTPLQGMMQIIRFNRHFYIAGLVLVSILLIAVFSATGPFIIPLLLVLSLSLYGLLASLLASLYVYDLSGLYQWDWLPVTVMGTVVNIHAGFDETSEAIREKYVPEHFFVFDFYDPELHTEISIRRARKASPPSPGTRSIRTDYIPLPDISVDNVFLIFAAHEIRNREERIVFFKEINRILKDNGRIVVVEHLRDLSNFLVYNFGFFHFYGEKVWKEVFGEAHFTIEQQTKKTRFVSAFILKKNGPAS